MKSFPIDLLIYLKYFFNRLPSSKIYESHIKNKLTLEVGGPTSIFKGFLPVYVVAKKVDNVVFSSSTSWFSSSSNSYNYFLNRSGNFFISEATNLVNIRSNSYRALISSNTLEHIANPIKALKEFHRILQPQGCIILVIPNKISNFDRFRPITTLNHLLQDYKNNTLEDDLTHLNEIINLHDLSLDKEAGNKAQFKKRSLSNFLNRTLHHHVFDVQLIHDVLVFSKFSVLRFDVTHKNFFFLAIKN